jgi:hypothetical protein
VLCAFMEMAAHAQLHRRATGGFTPHQMKIDTVGDLT